MLSTHKDRNPRDTIARIRKILANIGIFPVEALWNHAVGDCCSVTIRDVDLKWIFSNGKGPSRLYALASAYGEMIERIQNGYTISADYGLMPDDFSPPDRTYRQVADVAEVYSGILRELTASDPHSVMGLFSESCDTIGCEPFYCVNRGNVGELPSSLISMACGSNGMCAGNTPAEALCQGICEVFERYVIRCLYVDGKAAMPVIPLSDLKDTTVESLVEDIRDEGYEVLLRDCTLGGRLPVMGVTVLSRDRRMYKTHFGSDPVMEIAFQRCFTEILQGENMQSFRDRLFPVDFTSDPSSGRDCRTELFKLYVNSSGLCPPHMLFGPKSDGAFRPAFLEGFQNSSDSLWFLVNKVVSEKRDLYVRDVSFLGFPAYRVYIPGMSEIHPFNPETVRFMNVSGNLRKSLLRIGSLTGEQVREFISQLREILDIPGVVQHNRSGSFLQQLAGVWLSTGSDFPGLSTDMLMCLCGIRVGDSATALAHLTRELSLRGKQIERPEYFMAVAALLYCRARGESDRVAGDNMAALFPVELCEEILADFENPAEAFRYLCLPECGDCSKCPARAHCHYEDWKRIQNALAHERGEHVIRQDALAGIFG